MKAYSISWGLSLVFLMHFFASANAADIYVSPKGSDTNTGTAKAAPLYSLNKAKLLANDLKKSLNKDIVIELEGGVYYLPKTFEIGLADANLNGKKIIYQGSENQKCVISGGYEIKNWKKATSAPEGIDAKYAKNLWEADVSNFLTLKENATPEYCKERGTNILTLYKAFKRLNRASSEYFFTEESIPLSYSKVLIDPNFDFNPKAFDATEIHMRSDRPWHMNFLPIESYDEATLLISTKTNSTYQNLPFSKNRKNARLENYAPMLKNLDEWFYSEKNKKLYMLSESAPKDIFAPLLIELIKIEGKINSVNEADVDLDGIVIKNLSFAHTERFSPRKSDEGYGVQHDWDYYDRPTAAIRLRGAKNCIIENCSFENFASGAVRMDLSAKNNLVKDSYFANIGGTGVFLSGYGLGNKKELIGNKIENNYFWRTGQIFLHQSAIYVSMGVKNIVKNNTVRDCQYNGITVTGVRGVRQTAAHLDSVNLTIWEHLDPKFKDAKGKYTVVFPNTIPYLGGENIIEFNDVFRTGEIMGDTNGIYVSGCGKGNIIRYNFVHEMRGWYANASIRMDDNQTGAVISHNITYRNNGLGVISKGSNDIINNYFVETRRGAYTRGDMATIMTGAVGISIRGGHSDNTTIERNIIYVSGEGNPIPFQIWQLNNTRPIDFSKITSDKNLYWIDSGDTKPAEEQIALMQRKYDFEHSSLAANPKFKNIDAFDFSFPKDSPAAKLGIEPIDTSKIGVQGAMKQKYVLPALPSPKIVPLNFERLDYEPEAFPFVEGMQVKVEAPKEAQSVRYTLDGTYPTECSPLLPKDGKITIPSEGALQVVSFADGKIDYLGDRIIFTSSEKSQSKPSPRKNIQNKK